MPKTNLQLFLYRWPEVKLKKLFLLRRYVVSIISAVATPPIAYTSILISSDCAIIFLHQSMIKACVLNITNNIIVMHTTPEKSKH